MELTPSSGQRKYLARSAKQFSATRKLPPVGHKSYTGSIAGKKLSLLESGNTTRLKKVTRKSSVLGKKPPKMPLFSSTVQTKRNFKGGAWIKRQNCSIQMVKTFEQQENFPTINSTLNSYFHTGPQPVVRVEETVTSTKLTCTKTRLLVLLDWKD